MFPSLSFLFEDEETSLGKKLQQIRVIFLEKIIFFVNFLVSDHVSRWFVHSLHVFITKPQHWILVVLYFFLIFHTTIFIQFFFVDKELHVPDKIKASEWYTVINNIFYFKFCERRHSIVTYMRFLWKQKTKHEKKSQQQQKKKKRNALGATGWFKRLKIEKKALLRWLSDKTRKKERTNIIVRFEKTIRNG